MPAASNIHSISPPPATTGVPSARRSAQQLWRHETDHVRGSVQFRQFATVYPDLPGQLSDQVRLVASIKNEPDASE